MVVFHSYAEFPEGSYRNPRVYVEPTCLDELHWIVNITASLRRHYRLWLVWAIILKLPCSVRWVTLIIMYPDVWHTYLHLLPKISRRKVIYIYQRWMVWVRVKSCQVYLFNDLYHCFGNPTRHFPFYFNQPIEKTWFHYVPLHIYIPTTYSIVPPLNPRYTATFVLYPMFCSSGLSF